MLKDKTNVKRFIDANGVRCLVDLVTLSHLHTSRATTPSQTFMLEASQEQQNREEPEWYYTKVAVMLRIAVQVLQGDTKHKEGPIAFSDIRELFKNGDIHKDTKMWAQGMEGWRSLKSIPQLKW